MQGRTRFHWRHMQDVLLWLFDRLLLKYLSPLIKDRIVSDGSRCYGNQRTVRGYPKGGCSSCNLSFKEHGSTDDVEPLLNVPWDREEEVHREALLFWYFDVLAYAVIGEGKFDFRIVGCIDERQDVFSCAVGNLVGLDREDWAVEL